MQITPKIAAEICFHEGLVRQAYKDSVGVWTWSVGLTSATGHDVKRYIGKPQSLERCLEVFVWALGNYAEAVDAEFRGYNLTEEQAGAALSFHWNTGAIRSASWPDIWKAGDMHRARESFMEWRKPIEILPRRRSEAALFFDGRWSSDGTMTEYTRVRANGTPDWSSAQRIAIGSTMRQLFDAEEPTTPPADDTARQLAIATEKLEAIRAILEVKL